MLKSGDILNQRFLIEEITFQTDGNIILKAKDINLNLPVLINGYFFSDTNSPNLTQLKTTVVKIASIKCEGVLRLIDHFMLPDGWYIIVQEMLSGNTFQNLLAKNHVFSSQQIEYSMAMLANHLKSIEDLDWSFSVDLNPENVLFTPDEKIYIMNFGFFILDQIYETEDSEYLINNQQTPDDKKTQKSAVYSLGRLIYTLLTGKFPKTEIKPFITNYKQDLLDEMKEIHPVWLIEIVIDCLSPDPKQRPTIDEIIKVLETHKSKANVQTPQQTNPRKKLLIISLISIVLVGFFLILLIFVFQNSKETSQQNQTLTLNPMANQVLDIQESPTLTVILSTISPTSDSAAVIPTQTLSPTDVLPTENQKKLFAYTSNKNGSFQIWLMDINSGQNMQLTEEKFGACQSSWSPDGQKIIYVSPCSQIEEEISGGGLFILDLETKKKQPLPSMPGGDFSPVWSPNGNLILFTSLRNNKPQLFIYNLKNNQITKLSTDSSHDKQANWSFDGKKIIFTSTRLGETQIWIYDLTQNMAQEFSVLESSSDQYPDIAANQQFAVYSQGNNLPWLVIKTFDLGSKENKKLENYRPVINADISPDSMFILFQSWFSGQHQIYLYDITTEQTIQLTEDDFFHGYPDWKP